MNNCQPIKFHDALTFIKFSVFGCTVDEFGESFCCTPNSNIIGIMEFTIIAVSFKPANINPSSLENNNFNITSVFH